MHAKLLCVSYRSTNLVPLIHTTGVSKIIHSYVIKSTMGIHKPIQ